ncbi:MAG: TonB-dependent receptor [Luteolibacter sp.]|nr:TonB-dependent receptor [Luteolibacter sp.]
MPPHSADLPSTIRNGTAVHACLLLTAIRVLGQSPALLPEMLVLAERRSGDGSGAALAEWDREDMRAAAPRTIDELLDEEPAFSLYRRQTAIFGNPSSAGVSLRNTGATAASRTLVLLDGVPQNDPFGGWVYWARHDAAALESIRIVPSARAAVWGNQSPAGVIQMNSRAPFEERHVIKAGGGGQGTVAGSMVHQMTDAEKTKSLSFAAFGLHSDGFYAVGPSQRGSIDRKLDIDLWGADAKFAWLAAPGLTVEPGVSYYTEERGNGTPLARNSTDALDFSLRVTADNPGLSWQALAWHQRREFESVFSSVNADRSAETMALDQFDVPGRGTGGAITLKWDHGESLSFLAGADTRLVSGETNEEVGIFRRREAGGDQDFFGIFGVTEYRPDEATTVSGSARLDAWRLSNGRRIETSLINGTTLREDHQDDRDGIEPSASVELTRGLRDDLEARVSAGSGFRLPTLNELHRPYRVRNDIVEANPELEPERFVSIEAGLEWTPSENLTMSAALFHHWIADAVANVPVTDPAEIAEIFGTIPPGGSGSIKRNVDAARVAGIEGEIEWLPHEQVTLGLTGLWSDTRFSESGEQPLLEDKPFPQAPELRLIASGEWRPVERFALFAGCEYGSSQFDDALATRSIPDYTRVRIGASWRTERAIYQIRIENLFDEEIQTGLSSDGIRTLAGPRSLWLGAEWAF